MFDQQTATEELPLELIEREIESLAAQIAAGNARWLELVAVFDEREGWGGTGCRSTSEWIAWRCALTPRAAREHVRVARRLTELPEIRALFARGELSYSKVRALTRIAEGDSEADLIELARHATAAQLERIVRAARRVTSAEADQAQRGCFVRWYWDEDDGCLNIDAKLPPEDGVAFIRALEATQDALHEQWSDETGDETERGSAEPRSESDGPDECGSAEPRPTRFPTCAEALAGVADAILARPPNGLTGLTGGERCQVLVHVDAQTLATDSPGASATGRGQCAVADGPGIAPETARRLACDCSQVTIAEDSSGKALSVGRRTRSVPPSIRRALVARDGRCQFPGCERHRWVDAHHIHHWAQGGETSVDNLVLLCRHHHRLVHEGGFGVARHRWSRALHAARRTPDRLFALDARKLAAALARSPPRPPADRRRRPDGPRILRRRGARRGLYLDVQSALRADVAQLVERRLPKPKVAGSRPVVRFDCASH